ncbi:hypothetical protein GNF76_15715 [Pseudomonas sp. CCM 7893]|uniref:Uncharacterized protein n=1 Tax=Pseudomonas spelaei TaxID=1055469 RepID=A0A6I3WCF6_9PSED|nr:hypothetical protein [Pseudomonas spelaei]MUF05801.1 hypothetical protein [Pseudomonas spelaei]QLG90417.1 hypothetical protein HZF02_18550 [Pseudomonas yamanorum]
MLLAFVPTQSVPHGHRQPERTRQRRIQDPAGVNQGHSLAFVEAVDKLLYQAKRNGRMRAEFDVWVEE